MKSRLTIGLILTAWLLCTVGLARPAPEHDASQWRNAIRWHKAFSLGRTTVYLPGMIPTVTDTLTTRASGTVASWKSLGFSLRLATEMIPAWIFIEPDPDHSEMQQVVIREEVADRFSWPSSAVDRSADWIASQIAALGEHRASNTRVLIVPTKIAANRLRPAFNQIRRIDAELLGLRDPEAPNDPFESQATLERALKTRNISALSLIKRYRELQAEQKAPLYPRGESHWSGETIERLVKTVVDELLVLEPRIRACGRLEREIPTENTSALVWGDLFEALGGEPSFSKATSLRTLVRTFTTPALPSILKPGCPDVILLGSSYGAGKFSGISLAAGIQRLYFGRVIDMSVAGSTPVAQIRSIRNASIAHDAIVVWEFPFRYAKTFGD